MKPTDKNKETLIFEAYDVANQKWCDAFEAVCSIETKKFSSGGFRVLYQPILVTLFSSITAITPLSMANQQQLKSLFQEHSSR